jgi:hypothetical protein
MEKSPEHISIRVFNATRDVPYSDYFNLEENWVIYSPVANSNKCIIRFSVNVLFKKSTMFKSRIETNAIANAKNTF